MNDDPKRITYNPRMPDEPEGYEFVGWEFTARGNGRRVNWIEIHTGTPPELERGMVLIGQKPVWVFAE